MDELRKKSGAVVSQEEYDKYQKAKMKKGLKKKSGAAVSDKEIRSIEDLKKRRDEMLKKENK